MDLHQQLVLTKNYGPRPPSRVRLDSLRDFTDAFTAYLDGVPICAHLIIRDRESGTATHGPAGSVRRVGEPASIIGQVNKRLHWHEISHYKAAGIQNLCFDGVNREEMPSLARFKIAFGGELTTTYHYVLTGPIAKAAVRAREGFCSGLDSGSVPGRSNRLHGTVPIATKGPGTRQ